MENVSALMDGELEAHQADTQVTRLRNSDELKDGWETFHLIGDALRGERRLNSRIASALSERLAAEPTILAPSRTPARRPMTYALSAAASVAGVALVAWVALSTNPLAPTDNVVSAPVPGLAAAPQVANLPDNGKMNEYLLAHQGVSPSTVLQGLAPYVRTVTVIPDARR
jgi:sigma-E factor negative regulatory protein RseA